MPQRRFLSVALALAGIAAAQQASSPLKLVLSQFLVQTITKDGKTQEALVTSPKETTPGNVLEQQLQVSNTGSAALTNVRLQLPVPKGTTYMSQTGAPQGATTEFSFDGGKTYGVPPLKRTVTKVENGKSVTKEVTVSPTEYTNVRWTLPTFGGAQALKLNLRVKVQ